MPSSYSSGLRVRPPGHLASFTYTVPTMPVPMPAPQHAHGEPGALRCASGPWGEIEYQYMYLEASEHVISKCPMPSGTTTWTFPGATLESLAALFEAARIPGDWTDIWLKPPYLIATSDALHVLPPVQHLDELMPEQRAYLYAELARHPANEFHCDPIYLTSGSAEQFLRHTGVPTDTARWFARMCYRRGEVLCFSDVSALMSRARTSGEAVRFMKLCTRTRAIFPRLRVTDRTDCDALVAYWSDGERRKDMLPLLRGLTDHRQGLDLIHLLPPLARKLLNSYPRIELAVKGRMPDCHWSTFNFFNYEPRDYFLNTHLAASHIVENFQRVEGAYRYGDKLLFLRPNNDCFHSCVYIADDIVFTKNGENSLNPWILAHLSDLEQIYLSGKEGSVQGYRRKSSGAAA